MIIQPESSSLNGWGFLYARELPTSTDSPSLHGCDTFCATGQQLGLFAPAALVAEATAKVSADRPQLMTTLDELNARFGRGTVRLGSAVATTLVQGRAPWQGQARWQSGAFTTSC